MPQVALDKMMKEMTIVDLVGTQNKIVSEIKELDGNMKTLVYENYNKFILATDTIRKVNIAQEIKAV